MHDEMDARIWTAHHEQFSASIDDALGALGAGFRRRLASLDGPPGHVLSMAAALAVTLMTFNASIA